MIKQKISSYFKGVLWFILSLISSVINDILTKYVTASLDIYEVVFFRFLFCTITLIPFFIYKKINIFKPINGIIIHIFRGILLFFAMIGWGYGLLIVPIATSTVISFSIPVFVLVLSKIFLDECIIWQRWVSISIAFIGLLIILLPEITINSVTYYKLEILVFIFAAIFFASLDVINKKFIKHEQMLNILFYPALVTTILSFFSTFKNWVYPTINQFVFLFFLGISANLILLFLLKAFKQIDVTAVAPYRYLEFIISTIIAYFVFDEIPTKFTFYGALIIIPSTLFLVYSEKKVSENE